MNPEKQFDFAALVKAVDEDLKHTFTMLAVQESELLKVQTYFLNRFQTIRFALLADQLAISDTWKQIREVDCVLDLILDLTISIRFQADSLYVNGWERLVDLVISAVSVFHQPSTDGKVSVLEDERELERFINTSQAATFIKSNPWLVTLFVLRYSEQIRQLSREVTQVALQQQARDRAAASSGGR